MAAAPQDLAPVASQNTTTSTTSSSLSKIPAQSVRDIEDTFEQEQDSWVNSGDARKISIEELWEALHYDAALFSLPALSYKHNLKTDFAKIARILTNSVQQEHQFSGTEGIFFHRSQKELLGHPRERKDANPDFIVTSSSSVVDGEVHWAEVCAVVEIESNRSRGGHHAISYTLQLLQARPDLISSQGMYVSDEGIVLVIANSDMVTLSPLLQISDVSHLQLIYAFVKRLHEPHASTVDPTMQRRKDVSTGKWVFDITMKSPNDSSDIHCNGYEIISTHRRIGERSYVFCNKETPGLIDGIPIPIIKEQYLESNHKFPESEIFRHIHGIGIFPGVLQVLCASEPVLRTDGSPVGCGSLTKTRMGFRQFGENFMTLKTPLEAMMAIYDLLEISRSLYSTRNVLHRDISDGNVLHTTECITYELPDPSNEICFIRHMLDETVSPLSTTTLLVDFDHAEIVGAVDDDDDDAPHVGTRRYMARTVAGHIFDFAATMAWPAPPPLPPSAQAVYQKLLPARLSRFTCTSEHHFITVKRELTPKFRHRIWHDAESAFWLLAWWTFEAQSSTGPVSYFTVKDWYNINDITSYPRRHCFVYPESLDPVYRSVGDLLRNLSQRITCDPSWTKTEPYNHPDFSHEVMQRCILTFIIQNKDEPFMTIPKADEPRSLSPNAWDNNVFPDFMFATLKRPGSVLERMQEKKKKP